MLIPGESGKVFKVGDFQFVTKNMFFFVLFVNRFIRKSMIWVKVQGQLEMRA